MFSFEFWENVKNGWSIQKTEQQLLHWANLKHFDVESPQDSGKDSACLEKVSIQSQHSEYENSLLLVFSNIFWWLWASKHL